MKRAFVIVSAAMLCLSLVPSTQAKMLEGQDQESRVLSDRFNISLGLFSPNIRTDVAAGFGGAFGTFIRLEDQLGLEENTSAGRLDGFWRIKRKHAINFGYLVLDRSATRTIEEDIDFEDLTFTGTVNSEFTSTLFKLTYDYSFFNSGKAEVGISGGFSTYNFDAKLAGEIKITRPGEPDEIADGEADVSITAPVPSFGFFMGYAINPTLIFRARAEFFGLEISDYEARFVDAKITIDWYPVRNFGVGLGWNSTSIDYKDLGDNPFSVDYRYSGVMLFLSGTF
jgi:hypothetical protein